MSSQCFLLVCLTPRRTKKVVSSNKKAVWAERRCHQFEYQVATEWRQSRAGQGRTRADQVWNVFTVPCSPTTSHPASSVKWGAAYILRHNSQARPGQARSQLFYEDQLLLRCFQGGAAGPCLVLGKVGGSEGPELVGQHSHPGSWPPSDRLLATRKLLRALTAQADGRTVRIVFLSSQFLRVFSHHWGQPATQLSS